MKAVHFGAGNIGRGFVGLILHRAGYELVFADVNADLIDALAAADSYTVHEVGENPADIVVTGFRAVNSATAPDELLAEVATADIVTTAVGPNILRFIAPHIAAALRARTAEAPLIVMACENAINATDVLRGHIVAELGDDAALAETAIFANTAVDRIVPGQAADAGLDVTVETFFEWVIESGPFDGALPVIPDATFVDDLASFIERKLFTVNTGHATAAYLGFAAGIHRLSDALADPAIAAGVAAALEETSALLVAKHNIDAGTQKAYREKILRRFANPALPDTVDRVGREPERKLGRHERFIGPAAELAERGMSVTALLTAVTAAARFAPAEDAGAVAFADRVQSSPAEDIVSEVCGIAPEHPLYAPLLAAVRAAQA